MTTSKVLLFKQLLAILSKDELLRVRHRLFKQGNAELAGLVNEELEARREAA